MYQYKDLYNYKPLQHEQLNTMSIIVLYSENSYKYNSPPSTFTFVE